MQKFLMLIIAFILKCCVSLQAQEARLMIPIEHDYGVVSAKWSPNGKYIITASYDKTAKIWDVETGMVLADLKGHESELTDAIFSPNGLLVATTSKDGTAKLWNTKSGTLLFTLNNHISIVVEPFFSKNGRWLGTRSLWDKSIKIWDTESGELLTSIQSENNVPIQSYFNPEGNLLYAIFEKKIIQVWDWKAKLLVREVQYPNHPFCKMADISADGRKLLSVDSLGNLIIWDLSSLKLAGNFNFANEPEIIIAKFSTNGKEILIAKADFTLMTINSSTGERVADFLGHKGMITSIKYSPDGETIFSTSWDKKSKTWNAKTGKSIIEYEGFYESAEFDSSGQLIALSPLLEQPEIWDINGTFKKRLAGKTPPITGAQFSDDGKTLKINTSFDGNHIWNLNNGKKIAIVQSDGNESNSSNLSPNGELLAISKNKNYIELWDAQTGKAVTNLGENKFIVRSTFFSPNSSRIITLKEDSTCQVWDIATEKIISEFKGPEFFNSLFGFSATGKLIAISNNDNSIIILDAVTGDTTAKMIGHQLSIKTLCFSPDDTKILTSSKDGKAKLWDVANGELLGSFPVPATVYFKGIFSPDSSRFAIMSDSGNVQIYNTASLQLITSFPVEWRYNMFATFTHDSKEILWLKQDSIISVHDAYTGKLSREINLGYNTILQDINLTKGLIIATNNAEAKLFSLETGKHLASLFSFPDKDWAVVYPSGLFDASQGAMDIMYWVKDMEVIELSQLKEGYYQPGIWEMVMQGNKQIPVPDIENLGLHPEVELGELKDGILPVTITKRDGGYGKVVVFVNNKEVISDARPKPFDATKEKHNFNIDVNQFIYPGIDNEITVKAESEDGMLKSRGFSKKVKSKIELTDNKPAFYAIICGTSKYANEEINLNFTVDDARAIASAMSIGASNLFTKDSVHLYVLTSPGDNLTSKENIRKTFETVRKKAKPEDIVMVYLSGHGIAIDSDGKGDFYYLTKDAKSKYADDYKNKRTREPVTISTEELTQWMNAILAQKNIMIIDACGSGKAVDRLFTGRSLETSQLKAIDRMMERTGLFIISGCAADEESFESNSLGQGLLTYSILEGIKGAALKEDNLMDILNIFNHAREQVPRMAKEGGNKQEPQMLIPQKGSYAIGIINEEDKKNIPLAKPKPVFVKTNVVEKTLFDDTLNLSVKLNNKLRDIFENRTRANDIIFINEDKYPGACKITGGYSLKDNLYTFTGQVTCDQIKTSLSFENKQQEELINLIIEQSLKVAVKK